MRQALTDKNVMPKPGPSGPGFVRVRSVGEAEQHIESLTIRVGELERIVSDHAQRFDTLQTPWWKRVWFAIDGWPWYDLNGEQRRRPWHRSR